jgi:hypothetical protein
MQCVCGTVISRSLDGVLVSKLFYIIQYPLMLFNRVPMEKGRKGFKVLGRFRCRTYFDRNSLPDQRWLLWTIPFFSFIAGVIAYSISSLFFWRILVYTAVFHFVRQQYGFMRVYSRKEPKNTLSSWIDTATICYATLYPIIY